MHQPQPDTTENRSHSQVVSPPPVVTLTGDEHAHAADIGRRRVEANKAIGRASNHAPGYDPYEISILGALGEAAFHAYTSLEWNNAILEGDTLRDAIQRGNLPDFANDIEIRTRRQPWHQLCVHRNDPANWRYVSILQLDTHRYQLTGWANGQDIKHPDHWRPDLPYPAYAYPNRLLQPIWDMNI